MKFYMKLVVSMICFAVLISMSLSSFANAKATGEETEEKLGLVSELDKEFIDDEDVEDGLEGTLEVLSAIENLPDKVISQGSDAIVEWLNDHSDVTFSSDGENLFVDSLPTPSTEKGNVITAASIAGCVGQIGIAIVTNALPVFKITKVKKALQAAGGTYKFVSKLIRDYNSFRKLGYTRSKSYDMAFDYAKRYYGKETVATLLAIFNISAVKGACFD
ncbi:hypothetical protein CEY02_19475 [Bacillus pumilus]|uniref:Uncharacterized protein n=1 Tax=Bacillus pumilus TaxID=1408 RepID=A0A2A5IK41_BACPU|nr:hypothetical protein [Bacillus pumilus]PCK17710.1 hypothetical protein CEY02_19475 [Bacillus pumilus]